MKIVASQCNFTIGDFAGNTAKILNVIEKHEKHSDLIVFSELSLSGYYPMDLIERDGFVEKQNNYLEKIVSASKGMRAAIVVGFIDHNDEVGKPFHNSLAVIKDGSIVFKYHKKLLPTYNIFDEMRHFEPGKLPGVWELDGVKIGFLICEDAWNNESNPEYDHVPFHNLMDSSADIFITINASPSDIKKQQERIKLLSEKATKYGKPIVYVNQVGGNDELIFDGNSFAINNSGDFMQLCDAFTESEQLINFQDNEITIAQNTASHFIQSNEQLFYNQIILGLRDYCKKCGFRSVIIGSSGGIDSALTLALAADALGAENVSAITMPSHFSSSGSVDDSIALCNNLGVKLYEIPIKDAFDLAVERFTKAYNEEPSKLTRENIQARIRGQILMEYSNHFGSMLLSTGNKSELSVGYATLYGDMNGGLNLLGDLYKMEVYSLSNYINELHNKEVIPQGIIDKEPSAELSEGQKDTDSLPPYPVLDAILRIYIEHELLSDDEIKEGKKIIADSGFNEVDKIVLMVDRAEYKRRQAPPIIRVHRKSFGIGRRIPIVQKTPILNIIGAEN